ncbi:BI1-like protein [Asparagus officinalis]|uniref:BI1-like protein n=1 Tax=Asparagus officinalis TaxID=4686 RepID=UPI00098E523B|nr:BI1-like protein [Asparagus officinalis]
MGKKGDIEAGNNGALYPNMSESPQLRWAFIRKVYAIVTCQVLLTVAVAATVVFVKPIPDFLTSKTPLAWTVLILIAISPLITLIPMMFLREKHPWNLILLILFTVCISFAIGLSCSTKSGEVILEAAGLTAVVVVGLTIYTFWAAKRGCDFSFLGPFLFTAVLVMLVYCLLQIFLPLGKVGRTIYSCVAAVVFSAFIVYDTDNLIKRYKYDEYVTASISLYLDIINLFSALLNLLNS